jgi:transposase-like protein
MNKLIEKIITAKFSEGLKCDHCSSSEVIKYGRYKGIQRYKCNCCGKTFSDFSKTILAMTHYREKWVDFLDCFQKGLSLRKCSELLGISVPTAFSWRHKLLGAVSGTGNNKFSGLVEIGEIYIPENQKGNKNIETRASRDHSEYRLNRSIREGALPVIIAKDSYNNVISEVCDNGRLDRDIIDEKLGPLLDSTNTICTGNFAAYSRLANKKKMKHYRSLNHAEQDNKIFNIDNVRKYIKELKMWMKRFRGVASKYLSLYLAWFKLLKSAAYDETADLGTRLLLAAG